MPLGGRYPESSIGWYRKTFTVAGGPGKRYRIDFDGVYRDCRVWLNGHFIGQHESGYSGFYFDVTDWINHTGRNVLTVRVDATQNEGWFYEGAGIYRHVWLTIDNPVHIAREGIYAVPTVVGENGRLKVYVAVQNDSDKAADVSLGMSLKTPDGIVLNAIDLMDGRPAMEVQALGNGVVDQRKTEATLAAWKKKLKAKGHNVDGVQYIPPPNPVQPLYATQPQIDSNRIPAHGSKVFTHILHVKNAALWSIESPQLYTLSVEVDRPQGAGKNTPYTSTQDKQTVNLGFRTIRFDKDEGFFLNGKHVEIKGTCNHQDHAGVGSAVPDAVNEYRVHRLKEMGCNAYRTSHNDPTTSILDACDKQGMVVMDEHRLMDSNPDTLDQLRELVRRDRNHPCVILWSIGNEEPINGTEIGHRIAETMKRAIHQLDATRPVSCAANNGNQYEGVNQVMDLRGFGITSRLAIPTPIIKPTRISPCTAAKKPAP